MIHLYMYDSIKNKIIILLLILFSFMQPCIGQDLMTEKSIKIKLEQYYDVNGYIFPKETLLPLASVRGKQRFQPTIEEVTEAEKIIRQIIYMILGENELFMNRYNNYTRHYYRQYYGFINDNGEKIVIVKMVDAEFPEPYDTNLIASGPIFHTGFGPPHYRVFHINLISRALEPKSDPLLDSEWFLYRRETYQKPD